MAIQDLLTAGKITIVRFIQAINQEYKTRFPDLPDLFPPGSPLAAIWNTLIEVKQSPDDAADFSAEGELDVFPFNFGKNLKGTRLITKLKITITDRPDSS